MEETVGLARLQSRLVRWEQRNVVGPVVATTRRFFRIDGLDLGGLIAVELFTTVLPIMLIGYAWTQDFDRRARIGTFFARLTGVEGADLVKVQAEFGTAAGLARVWTFLGLGSFLVWGIPMALTVARMYAVAWDRQPHPIQHRLWRGTIWFVAYLGSLLATESLFFASTHVAFLPLLLPVSFAVSAVFWGLTPLLLVPGVRWDRRAMLAAGLIGAVVNVLVLRPVLRSVFPLLLAGWNGFGPIGVAFSMMTWSGVLGVGWVVTACGGAVLVERVTRSAATQELDGDGAAVS